MAQVTLKNVWKKYGDLAVVKDVSLTIPDKSFYVMVGPSGCGKSTTLRMIAGLEEITDGEIYIDDRLVNNVPPKSRDIAMVFQNYALYPHMTVYENMAFGLKLRRVPKKEIDERVQEAAQILDISHLLERRPKALSGGQRQRVAVGRAIVRKPKVFLFDEPLSNLDAKMRGNMRLEIAKIHKKLQTTIIYVTHDQLEAMTLASHVALMKDGTVQQVAPPLEIYNSPANKFVAGFIGNPPMNFFDVAVKKEKENIKLVFGKNGSAVNLDPPADDESAAARLRRKKRRHGRAAGRYLRQSVLPGQRQRPDAVVHRRSGGADGRREIYLFDREREFDGRARERGQPGVREPEHRRCLSFGKRPVFRQRHRSGHPLVPITPKPSTFSKPHSR